jgi:hypothetical protein
MDDLNIIAVQKIEGWAYNAADISSAPSFAQYDAMSHA